MYNHVFIVALLNYSITSSAYDFRNHISTLADRGYNHHNQTGTFGITSSHPIRSSIEVIETPKLRGSTITHHYGGEQRIRDILHNIPVTTTQSPYRSSDKFDNTIVSDEEEVKQYSYFLFSTTYIHPDRARKRSGPCGVRNLYGLNYKLNVSESLFIYNLWSTLNRHTLSCEESQSSSFLYLADNAREICQL